MAILDAEADTEVEELFSTEWREKFRPKFVRPVIEEREIARAVDCAEVGHQVSQVARRERGGQGLLTLGSFQPL